MPAAQLADCRFAPNAPKVSAIRGTARSVGLSLLLHGGVVAAIAGLALQAQAPQGEALLTVEYVLAAVSAAAPAAGDATQAAPQRVHEPPSPTAAAADPAASQPAMPDVAALPEPEDQPPPEPVAEMLPAPKPKPRPPAPAKALAKPVVPPAPTLAAQGPPAAAIAAQQPAAAGETAGVATEQQGFEQQAAAAATGSSEEPPVVTQPRFRAPPNPPEYPPRARAMEQQGVSVVRALVDTDGTSREIRLWRSSGFDALDRAALAAVRGWRFEAARRGAQPVLAWVEIPVRFELR